jgi:predicted ATPase/DNA-binding SARP family transcriptional activator
MTLPDPTHAAFTVILFGPMKVLVHGQPLPHLRSRKTLWLLALLTLRHDRPVEREWLAGTLWPDVDQSQAFATLRPALSELRKALGSQGDRLQSPSRHTLHLDLRDAHVDILAFDTAINSKQLSALAQAVTIHCGPLLEGCTEEWVFQERAVREQRCLQALQTLADAALAAADYETAVGHYQRAVGMDPLSDAARRGWMEALSRRGDRNAALQVYREFVDLLHKDDPKAMPDEQTSALHARLRAAVRRQADAQIGDTPAQAAKPVITGYLPHPLTDLIGREDERLEVAARLRRSRLVTLTGLGGIGKTRLALDVAAEVIREYTHGVWLVSLEALTDSKLMVPLIASVLGLREESGQPLLPCLTEALSKKRLLLVLDNCEHLLAASAQTAEHLLRECAGLRILATSREPLRVTGEAVWVVPSLAVPDMNHLPQGRATLLRVLMGYESVQLFVERAQAVQKTFALDANNAIKVAEVCSQLEGIPLAIELAAARVKAMTVEQIADRLNDHLGLLAGKIRVMQSRQQTLRAALDWSYALLNEPEQTLLRRLSVLVGSWSLEAAESVCAASESQLSESQSNEIIESTEIQNPKSKIQNREVLDLLSSVVDKSLVAFKEQAKEVGGTYRLSETVRQYAAERLDASDEADQVRARHCDYFLAVAEEAEPQLQGAEQGMWLARLETVHENMRAALAWCRAVDGRAESGVRLAGALWRFWEIRGYYSEGRATLSEALRREGAHGRTKARAKAANGAGVLASYQGDYGAARALHEESLAISRELGDKEGIAWTLHSLGDVVSAKGDLATAGALQRECLALQRELGNKLGIGRSLISLGTLAAAQDDSAAACALYAEGLSIQRELEDKRGAAESLQGLAAVMLAQPEAQQAVILWAIAHVLRESIGSPLPLNQHEAYARQLEQARAALGADAFTTAWEEGASLMWEQAISTALALAGT